MTALHCRFAVSRVVLYREYPSNRLDIALLVSHIDSDRVLTGLEVARGVADPTTRYSGRVGDVLSVERNDVVCKGDALRLVNAAQFAYIVYGGFSDLSCPSRFIYT